MLHIVNPCTDPYFNLALEEYFLKNEPAANDLVILWRNAPTVVVGRNQNTAAEINQPFIADRHIQVVRRLSGGGAVYHDLGNLNFTFITAASGNRNKDFFRFSVPVIDALATLGVKAKFSGRNDLTIDGQKFSGNAQYLHHGRLLHHGTLLFDTDLTILAQALAGPEAKYSPPAVPSVRSRVTTIRPYLKQPITITEFEDILLKAVFRHAGTDYRKYALSVADCQSIEALARSRYQDPAWNYGTLPPYNRSSKKKFAGGTVQVLLNIQNETIQHCKIFGDFFATGDIDDLEAALSGTAYSRESLGKIIAAWLAEHPIHDIALDNLLACFFPNL
ncbi:lipoate--protein ligase [Anaeroselena agilis]|uniref:lipoate--protein ligase n=1 Tax=Anaeroselena agilis TaxID=3063788 RepID=A0ABU3NU20_9FIRM|nr:lipoate--protein ligase [Selenomonadales bacterium 4137-cl]